MLFVLSVIDKYSDNDGLAAVGCSNKFHESAVAMLPDPKPILVIIPFYKNKEELDLCLKALSEQNVKTQIYVRDNSCDNILYTKAINEGLRKFAFSGDFDDDCKRVTA